MNSDLCVYISENHYFSRWPDVRALLHTGIGSTATHLPRLVFVPSHLILEMAQLFIVGYQESANHQNPVDLLLHGFGANAMRQYGKHLQMFTSRFNVYVPDLLFFGESYTSRPERTGSFQAQCVMRLMEAHGVHRMNLVGISYGRFVGYSMAAQFQEKIERVVLCCAVLGLAWKKRIRTMVCLWFRI
jgi:pimeloyl-ACP methyl ester carboxylesterase